MGDAIPPSLISQHFIRRVYQVDSSYLVHYHSVRKFDKNASLIVAKGGGRRGVLGGRSPPPCVDKERGVRGKRSFPLIYALSNSFPSCCDISATLSCKTSA